MFLTIAIGLAVGVTAYSVAFAGSSFFNLVVIGLWLTDFARLPAELVPAIAAKRVQIAKDSAANRRTNEYVVQLDQQLLQSMTPDQLKALADRALERGQEYEQRLGERSHQPAEVLGAMVAVRAPKEAAPGLRVTTELVLERDTKEWRFEDETMDDDGAVVLRYRVRCRKKMPSPLLQDSLRRALAPMTNDVTVR
jgi:hypothetical protein